MLTRWAVVLYVPIIFQRVALKELIYDQNLGGFAALNLVLFQCSGSKQF